MASKDLHNNIDIKRAISPVSVSDNTAQVSQILDTRGYESIELVIATGSIADSDATFVVLIEDGDSATLTDAAAVSDTFLLGTEALASFQFDDDNECRKIGYVGGKRYVRATITPANNASAALLSAVWMMNRSTIGQIRRLKDGDGEYLWAPGLAGGVPNTINGAPYVEAADMPDVGASAKPVAFGDFRRGYVIVDRIAMEMLRDPYTQATSGAVRMIFRRRVGGQVVLPEAIVLQNVAL